MSMSVTLGQQQTDRLFLPFPVGNIRRCASQLSVVEVAEEGGGVGSPGKNRKKGQEKENAARFSRVAMTFWKEFLESLALFLSLCMRYFTMYTTFADSRLKSTFQHRHSIHASKHRPCL